MMRCFYLPFLIFHDKFVLGFFILKLLYLPSTFLCDNYSYIYITNKQSALHRSVPFSLFYGNYHKYLGTENVKYVLQRTLSLALRSKKTETVKGR